MLRGLYILWGGPWCTASERHKELHTYYLPPSSESPGFGGLKIKSAILREVHDQSLHPTRQGLVSVTLCTMHFSVLGIRNAPLLCSLAKLISIMLSIVVGLSLLLATRNHN